MSTSIEKSRQSVLFINRSYWPDAEATGQLLTELCGDLSKAFDVSVVCGQVVQNPDKIDHKKAGRCCINGVTIHRVRHTTFNKRYFLGRICNMVTFLLMATTRALTLRRPDIVVVETDPPLLCILGRLLQLVGRCKLVCYLQDVYPDVAVALGKLRPGILTRSLSWMFYGVYQMSDRVVVLSGDMQRHLESRGVPAPIITCIPNWVDTEVITPHKTQNSFRTRHNLNNELVVMYSGNMGLSQPLGVIVDAAEHLQHDEKIRFVMIGNGAGRASLEADISTRRLSNLLLLDYQAKSDLAHSLSAADLHIVFLDDRITSFLMPSKIYGIMGSGTASIVLASEDSELAQVVAQQGIGEVLPSNSPAELADKIVHLSKRRDLIADMGQRARALAVNQYDRKQAFVKFSELLNELA